MRSDTATPPAADTFDIDLSDAFSTEEPPAPVTQPAPPPPEDGKVDLADFKPERISFNSPIPDEEVDEQPPTPVEQPKPIDNAPGPKELRKAYEATKSERDALKAEKAEIESAKAQLEQEREQLRNQLGEATKHLSYRDPSTHPEVQAMHQEINREIHELPKMAMMSSKQSEALRQLAPTLIGEISRIGDPGTDGYDQRRENLMTKVHDNFGENGDRVLAVLVKASETMHKVERKMAEIKEMGGVNGFQEAKQRHDAMQADYLTKFEAGFFHVSPEFSEANPYHSKSIIAKMVNENPKLKAAAEEIKKIIRKATIPPPPINPKELDQLKPEERDQMLNQRASEHRKAAQHLASRAAEGQLAYEVVGHMAKKIADLEAALKLRTGEIPSPRSGAPSPPSSGEIEVKDFQPSRIKLG
jgi:hypothetical protein